MKVFRDDQEVLTKTAGVNGVVKMSFLDDNVDWDKSYLFAFEFTADKYASISYHKQYIQSTKKDDVLMYSHSSIVRKTVQPQLLKDFFDFCEEYQGRGLPKNLTGIAVNHALNQKDTFMTFLEDPKLELSNNAAERASSLLLLAERISFSVILLTGLILRL